MRSLTPVALIALAALGMLAAPALLAKDHPSLVNAATAKCATCHEAVLANAVKHPAALDGGCTSCHDFTKADGKTSVKLSAGEPQLCVTCHDDKSKAADGTLAAPHAPVTSACTSCHNPHSTADAHLLTSTPPSLCLTCHDAATIDPKHKRTVSRSDCRGCHLPHGSANAKLLKAAAQHPPFAEKSCQSCHKRGGVGRGDKGSAKVCYACHTEQGEKFAKGAVHTIVRQGRCEACHDPHLSDRPKFLLKDKQQLCISCHDVIAAKLAAANVHPPAKDDCSTCHDPHRSDNPFQLTDTQSALCTMCHDAGDAALKKKHLGADLAKLSCTGCHDPHGSTEKNLVVARSVHPPFADRSCDLCHEGAAAKLVEGGRKELCAGCHGEIAEIAAKAAVPHAAMEVADCVDCHTPHASRQAKLVREPAGGECLTCHEEKKAGAGEFQHGVIALLGCEGCHEPHGGSRPRLLRANPDQLCLGCHDKTKWKIDEKNRTAKLLDRFVIDEKAALAIPPIQLVDGVRDHPIPGHPTLGPTGDAKQQHGKSKVDFEGELHCSSCHDPHKGSSPRLFVNHRTDVCSKCHAK